MPGATFDFGFLCMSDASHSASCAAIPPAFVRLLGSSHRCAARGWAAMQPHRAALPATDRPNCHSTRGPCCGRACGICSARTRAAGQRPLGWVGSMCGRGGGEGGGRTISSRSKGSAAASAFVTPALAADAHERGRPTLAKPAPVGHAEGVANAQRVGGGARESGRGRRTLLRSWPPCGRSAPAPLRANRHMARRTHERVRAYTLANTRGLAHTARSHAQSAKARASAHTHACAHNPYTRARAHRRKHSASRTERRHSTAHRR